MPTKFLFPAVAISLLFVTPVFAKPPQPQPLGVQKQESIWKPFSPTDGGFTVLMPGTPKEITHTQNTAAGAIPVQFFVVERPGEATYVVILADFPPVPSQTVNANQVLDGAMNGAINSFKGNELLSQESITLGSYPGRDVKVKTPGGTIIRNRMYLVNRRLYQVMVETTPQQERQLTKSIQGFMDSFKLKS